LGVLASFVTIHFTNALDRGGVKFSELFRAFGQRPWEILVYLAMLLVPALVAAVVVPWSIRWVKSGT
jgi:hypothetical protein